MNHFLISFLSHLHIVPLSVTLSRILQNNTEWSPLIETLNWLTQGKWCINTDFHGVRGVCLCTVRTPYTRCKSLRKSVVIPCITTDLKWYHNGLMQTFATCIRCPHGEKTDSFDPMEVRIHALFSLCEAYRM